MMRPFLLALQFLTLLPVRLGFVPTDEEVGRSIVYYPLVGVVLGILLVMLDGMLEKVSPLLAAALVAAAWAVLTGGLHLDGLADTADAWVGGRGDRERMLAIMKDPYCGPAAAVTLILLLMIKIAALHVLVGAGESLALLLAPVLGRTAILLLFLTTPYVRAQGLGSVLVAHLPRRQAIWMVAVTAVMVIILVGLERPWPFLAALMAFAVMRHMMMTRIQGTTGDTAGALVEIVETSVLVSAALSV